MFLINEERIYTTNKEDKRRVIIQADTTPEVFPADGGSVAGLADTALIARGSILYDVTTGKRYFMDENEEYWVEYGTGETEEAVPTDNTEDDPGEGGDDNPAEPGEGGDDNPADPPAETPGE